MRFGQVPNNQLNINFDNPEDQPKSKEQIRDESVNAILADCESAKLKRLDSKPMVTSIKKIKEMIEAGQTIGGIREVDAEAERKSREYWDKIFSGIRPKEKPEAAHLGEKIKNVSSDFVDYKKSQYKDDVDDEL